MSISDELMWRYFELVLCLPVEEVTGLREAVASGAKHPREVKDELSRRIVEKFYGAAAGAEASAEFARVFSQNQLPTDIPEVALSAADLQDGKIGILNLLVKANLAASTSEARRLVQAGAVRIGEEKITDVKAYFAPKTDTIIRSGKRGFAKIILQ
jgi:tyrosyl-tRNA synthetase